MLQKWNWAGLSIFNHSWLCECVCVFSNTPKIDGFTLYNISKWKSSNLPNLDLVCMQPLSCRWPSAATLTCSTIYLTLHIILVSCTMLFMGKYFVFKWDIYLNMNRLCVFAKNLKMWNVIVIVWSLWIHSFFYIELSCIPMINVIYLVLAYGAKL